MADMFTILSVAGLDKGEGQGKERARRRVVGWSRVHTDLPMYRTFLQNLETVANSNTKLQKIAFPSQRRTKVSTRSKKHKSDNSLLLNSLDK